MKAVAYARFSSDNQREESVTAQLRAIREYAEKHGVTIVREYIDEAESATTDARPGFLRMIADLRGGLQVNLVLIHKFDRFARNRYDSAVYKREIQRAGARLLAVAQPLDDSPESIILEAMLEAMAEYYSKNLARETMKGMRETAYQGKHTGGKPPLGYDVDPATRRYVINEHEARALRLIYSMTLEGHGYSEIIDTLNARGYRTKAGQPFGKNSIHDILRNEKYAGIYVFNRAASAHFGKRNNRASKPGDEIIRLPGGIPAIVSHDEWRRVQAIMDTRKRQTPRRKGDILYILTGYVYCGECSGAMTGSSAVGGRNRTRYHLYVCNTKRRLRTCHNPNIRKELVEGFVLDEIAQLFMPDRIGELAEKLEERYRAQRSEIDAGYREIAAALDEVRRRIDNVFEALETGGMRPEVAGPRANELAEQKALLESRLAEIEMRRSLVLTRDKILEYLKKHQQALVDRTDESACRHLVEAYVDRVTVYRDRVEVVLKVGTDLYKGGGGGPLLTLYKLAERDALYAGSRFSTSARARWRGHPSKKQG